MKPQFRHNLNKLPPKESQNRSLRAMQNQPAMSREERREVLTRARSDLTPYLDDEDRRLANKWGVAIGSNAWVDLMTRHCIATQIQQNSAASELRSSGASESREQPLQTVEIEHGQERFRSPISDDAAGAKDTAITSNQGWEPNADPSPPSPPPNTSAPSTSSKDSQGQTPKSQRLVIKITGLKRLRADDAEAEETTSRDSKRPKTHKLSAPPMAATPISNTPETESTSSTTTPPQSLNTSTTSTMLTTTTTTTSTKPYKCREPTCKFFTEGFKRREHLRRHESSVHDKRVVAWCEKCGAAFTRTDNAKVHRQTCSGAK